MFQNTPITCNKPHRSLYITYNTLTDVGKSCYKIGKITNITIVCGLGESFFNSGKAEKELTLSWLKETKQPTKGLVY